MHEGVRRQLSAPAGMSQLELNRCCPKQIFHISQAKCRSSELSLLPVATTVLVVVVIVGAANFLPTPVDMLKVS